jgi:hypothetical protein
METQMPTQAIKQGWKLIANQISDVLCQNILESCSRWMLGSSELTAIRKDGALFSRNLHLVIEPMGWQGYPCWAWGACLQGRQNEERRSRVTLWAFHFWSPLLSHCLYWNSSYSLRAGAMSISIHLCHFINTHPSQPCKVLLRNPVKFVWWLGNFWFQVTEI